MAERPFTRNAILDRLRNTIAEGKPIIGAGASVGIVAKCAEAAGADLIIVLCTGKSRIMGLPTTVRIGNANDMTLGQYAQIANVVENTPIVGGAEAICPLYRQLPRLVKTFRDTGFDGIANSPSVAASPGYGQAREGVGQGISREYNMIRLAREQDYFTMGYAYDADHARGLAAAGADVVIAEVGWTVGGMAGAATSLSFADSAELIQKIIEGARGANPDVICLAHGGPYATPDDTDYLYEHTGAQGFVGESAIERIPLEWGIRDAIASFKAAPLRPSAIRFK